MCSSSETVDSVSKMMNSLVLRNSDGLDILLTHVQSKIWNPLTECVSSDTPLSDLHTTTFRRFMGIAEQMGRTLQRTSISVNIKERLDFSCALFGPAGDLVANAPHLPVHLGAMSEAVRAQVRLLI